MGMFSDAWGALTFQGAKAPEVDHCGMKLGRLPVRFDVRVPLLHRYMQDLPAPPAKVDWTKGVTSFGMMRNDSLGDCTAAGIGHLYQIWTNGAYDREWTPTDEEIVDFYSVTTGYDPTKPETDRGGVEVDVLTYLLKYGFCKRRIAGFGSLPIGDPTVIKQAIDLFGGVYIGVALPLSAQTQVVWDAPSLWSQKFGRGRSGSWGGHCVAVVGYDADGLTCITWGAPKRLTWAFWNVYGEEAYGILAAAWIKDGKAPSGFAYAALEADLAALRA